MYLVMVNIIKYEFGIEICNTWNYNRFRVKQSFYSEIGENET